LTDKALVALEGVDDLVVVATQDAVLVSRQKDANGLKRLVAKLKTRAPEVTEIISRCIARGEAINRSTPEIVTSQAHRREAGKPALAAKHHHRSEHWIVVAAAARNRQRTRQDRARMSRSTSRSVPLIG